jgi:hypothetical protein
MEALGIEEDSLGPGFCFAVSGGLAWLPPGGVNDRLTLNTAVSSGARDDTMRAFLPVNTIAQGKVLRPKISGLALAEAGYTPCLHAQETAFFREINGTVEIKTPGSAEWVKAAAGDGIEKNTIISTGFKSTAALVVGDSVITVRPVTRLSLEEIIRNQDSEQVNLYLHTGRVRAEVSPPSGRKTDFTVRSPVATASVRGTSFEFDTENLRVDEGRVQYSLANRRQGYVAAGGISYVDETNNTVVSPFEAAAKLLVPTLPVGSGSGGPVGDHAPAISPGNNVPAISPVVPADAADVADVADVGVGFGWD